MDFTLALTHFCETHGPRSILCTQVLPLECDRCLPLSPALHPQSSIDSLQTRVHESEDPSHSIPSLRRHDTNNTLTTDFSHASTAADSDPERESVSIERHPYFKAFDPESSQFRYGRGQSDTCASCNFSVPQEVASKLPSGAPGSSRRGSSGKNASSTSTSTSSGGNSNTASSSPNSQPRNADYADSAPVLRSREFVCLGTGKATQTLGPSPGSSHGSKSSDGSSSLDALLSPHAHAHADDCHDHTLTYLTSKSPESALTYATLRNSVVRTLSCELLPRGMSDGPFCFGDSTTGYTIAHSFRLPDPKARGRRRTYAFVALAGTDASRAFKACPLIWEAFAKLAKSIEAMATRKQENARRQQDEEEALKGKRNYSSVSSFLTQRQIEPDGTPRRAGQTTPRSLSDIVGDDHIFAILHQYFVALLKCLGDRFGGLPLADNQGIYHIVPADESFDVKTVPTAAHTTTTATATGNSNNTIKDNTNKDNNTATSVKSAPDASPNSVSSGNAVTSGQTNGPKSSSQQPLNQEDISLLKKRMSQSLSLQCAPIGHETAGPTQVVM